MNIQCGLRTGDGRIEHSTHQRLRWLGRDGLIYGSSHFASASCLPDLEVRQRLQCAHHGRVVPGRTAVRDTTVEQLLRGGCIG